MLISIWWKQRVYNFSPALERLLSGCTWVSPKSSRVFWNVWDLLHRTQRAWVTKSVVGRVPLHPCGLPKLQYVLTGSLRCVVFDCLLPCFQCVSHEMLAWRMLCANKFGKCFIFHHLLRNLRHSILRALSYALFREPILFWATPKHVSHTWLTKQPPLGSVLWVLHLPVLQNNLCLWVSYTDHSWECLSQVSEVTWKQCSMS